MITKQKANNPSYVTIGVTSFIGSDQPPSDHPLAFILPAIPFFDNQKKHRRIS